tara:strand:+ start:1149 stop:1538 length:390 start_codon:yes stop_codon:yes gene_type:complete
MIKKPVWTNGCFDILHVGHLAMLRYAASLGDHLIVGVDTDDRVAKSKGPDRPINCLQDRIDMLEAIKYVDAVVSFNTDKELESLIKSYSPSHLVVGADYIHKRVIGAEHATQVMFFEKIPGYSTTSIIQ